MFKKILTAAIFVVGLSGCLVAVDSPPPYYPPCGYVDGYCDTWCEVRVDPDCMAYDPSCEGYYGYCEDYDGYCDMGLYCCYYDSDCY